MQGFRMMREIGGKQDLHVWTPDRSRSKTKQITCETEMWDRECRCGILVCGGVGAGWDMSGG